MSCSGQCTYVCTGHHPDGSPIWSRSMSCTQIGCACNTSALPESATIGQIAKVNCIPIEEMGSHPADDAATNSADPTLVMDP